jgi:hypothetical protein
VTATKAPPTLAAELRTFAHHRDELLGRAKGKFVLIKGDAIVGVFENRTDALSRGYREFGNNPFLVKQVTEIEVPLNFTSFRLGDGK